MQSKLIGAAAALVFFGAAAPERASAAVSCGDAPLSGVTAPTYVSPTGHDTPSCGRDPATPCGSLQQGLAMCSKTAGCNSVLVHYGRYDLAQTVQLVDGVNIYGACRFAGGPTPHYRTVLLGPPGGQPLLNAASVNKPTLVFGLSLLATDATSPGAASVAMTVGNSSGLALRATVLVSGQGGPGADGVTASAVGPGGSGQPASGASSGQGANSCPSNHTTNDGRGGDGYISYLSSLYQGCNFAIPGGTPTGGASGSVQGGQAGANGTHGIWCKGRRHDYPTDGHNGEPGATGQAGGVATASPLIAGTVAQTTWQPSKGGNGAAGAVGSGGGGGGAGGSCDEAFFGTGGVQGFGGGGGGGGGCGGAAGTGGQQGGASIGLILSASQVSLDHIGIIPGAGGRGGKGGGSVSGGGGGAPGPGVRSGQSLFWGHYCGGLSGDGGPGGRGGAGSGAAGGNGGPSLGIALAQNSPAPPSDSGIYPGVPGSRGARGGGGPAVIVNGVTVAPPGPDGQDGQLGAAAPWMKY